MRLHIDEDVPTIFGQLAAIARSRFDACWRDLGWPNRLALACVCRTGKPRNHDGGQRLRKSDFPRQMQQSWRHLAPTPRSFLGRTLGQTSNSLERRRSKSDGVLYRRYATSSPDSTAIL